MTRLILIAVFVAALWVGYMAEARDFGNTTAESGNFNMNNSTNPVVLLYNTFTAGTDDTIKAIYIRQASGAGGDDSLKVAIYRISGGTPTTRATAVLEMGVASSAFPTYAWDSVIVNFACASGTEYGIGFGNILGSGTQQVFVAYDATATSGDGTQKDFGTTLPSTWIGTTDNDDRYSVYATLNTLGGPTGPPNVRHGPSGAGQRHGPDGASVRHGP